VVLRFGELPDYENRSRHDLGLENRDSAQIRPQTTECATNAGSLPLPFVAASVRNGSTLVLTRERLSSKLTLIRERTPNCSRTAFPNLPAICLTNWILHPCANAFAFALAGALRTSFPQISFPEEMKR
jgi:hypothetical protein